jgi:phage-related tail protein
VQRKKELMKEPAMAGEGNMFAQAVQKAKAAGMKAGDKFKVGDQEYTLKDAIEMAGLKLEEFFSEEEMAYDNQIERITRLAHYQ